MESAEMKQLAVLGICAILMSCMTSCGKTYTTPLKHDTLFTTPNPNKHILEKQGEGFEKRGDYLVVKKGLTPQEGESYAVFQNRLINTLAVQEYDKQAYQELILQKKASIDKLRLQLDMLQEKNHDLREDYASFASKKDYNVVRQQAFKAYKVQKGDTLQKISKNMYGTYTGWIAIYQFNQFYLKSANMLKVGDLIWIPAFNNI
jgi:nucleoid-associated protein YgaU